MPLTTPNRRYSLPAIALHWLMALGLIGAIAVGWWASEMPMSIQRLKLIKPLSAHAVVMLAQMRDHASPRLAIRISITRAPHRHRRPNGLLARKF